MKTKVGSPGDDPEQRRRFAIAIPSAIAITALFVAIGRVQPSDQPLAERHPVTTVRLERIVATPKPTPAPTPKPTPRQTPKPVVRVTLAPVPQRAATAMAVRHTGGGTSAARHAVPVPAAVHPFAQPNAAGGTGTAIAADAGQGSGSGDAAGSRDAGGNGDTGNAAVNADAPCGTVDLIPFQNPERRGSNIYESIRATVTFPDGHTQSAEFPYRFGYTDPADDPWSAQNIRNEAFVTRVQLPPPGTSTSRFPELIRYIIEHTRANGTTVLQECPRLR